MDRPLTAIVLYRLVDEILRHYQYQNAVWQCFLVAVCLHVDQSRKTKRAMSLLYLPLLVIKRLLYVSLEETSKITVGVCSSSENP